MRTMFVMVLVALLGAGVAGASTAGPIMGEVAPSAQPQPILGEDLQRASPEPFVIVDPVCAFDGSYCREPELVEAVPAAEGNQVWADEPQPAQANQVQGQEAEPMQAAEPQEAHPETGPSEK